MKVVLYGVGLEAEKFWARMHYHYDIIYCLDRKQQKTFHGIPVYNVEDKKEELKKVQIIVTPVGLAYFEIKQKLENMGLQEFKNFISARLFGRKLVSIYGNCHMNSLKEYLINNVFFSEKYITIFHYIGEKNAPQKEELEYCSVFITQDIRKENEFGMPSANELCKFLKKGKSIVVPNLYGYNLFFPQCYFPEDGQVEKHFGIEALDIRQKDELTKQNIRVTVNSIGKRDWFIDKMFCEGASLSDIENAILYEDVFDEKNILNNFRDEIMKLKKREKKCDLKISDYIEDEYKRIQLFYEPFHPSEELIIEMGRRILKLLEIPIDETIQIKRSMDAMEMPIYGEVYKTLGLVFERRKFMRRNCSSTLGNKPETLREYIDNYIKWVWGKDIK